MGLEVPLPGLFAECCGYCHLHGGKLSLGTRTGGPFFGCKMQGSWRLILVLRVEIAICVALQKNGIFWKLSRRVDWDRCSPFTPVSCFHFSFRHDNLGLVAGLEMSRIASRDDHSHQPDDRAWGDLLRWGASQNEGPLFVSTACWDLRA